jgi:hypothetical protein
MCIFLSCSLNYYSQSKITELRKQKGAVNGNDKKLRVCDVCGSFLSLYDSDK